MASAGDDRGAESSYTAGGSPGGLIEVAVLLGIMERGGGFQCPATSVDDNSVTWDSCKPTWLIPPFGTARRSIKRISGNIYKDYRKALKDDLSEAWAKTVTGYTKSLWLDIAAKD
ncbi:unnamed protein product [Clonostachys rosea f. rosea IK726]|uniref:Uncharacterized protein n=1 Tax=Clonostachys rosea f. rosea IK726 TaxID=1349383 RepID=A0ACA9UEI5_BIOOC|nr:unnamed protein product [Clonostachys rosea f. rosea IK726]